MHFSSFVALLLFRPAAEKERASKKNGWQLKRSHRERAEMTEAEVLGRRKLDTSTKIGMQVVELLPEPRTPSHFKLRLPLQPSVSSLPAYRSLLSDVYTTSQKAAFASVPLGERKPNFYYPRAPLLNYDAVGNLDETQPGVSHWPRDTEYANKFVPSESQVRVTFAGESSKTLDTPESPQNQPGGQGWRARSGEPQGDNAMSLAHDYVTKPLVWSTTHERTYKAPADLRPYSQHLLRFKTTSSLTAPSVHGSIASGVHVVKVGSRSVAAGTAPAEGFYPVRRPTGSREFLEVQYDSGAATPQLPRTAKVTGLSQVQPPQVTLLRHLTSFDHGPTTSDEQTVRQQFAGLPPTTDSNLGMRTQRAAMVSKFAKLTSAVTHSGHTSEFRQTFMDPCADSAEVEATMDELLEQRVQAHTTMKQTRGNNGVAFYDIPAGLGKRSVESALRNRHFPKPKAKYG